MTYQVGDRVIARRLPVKTKPSPKTTDFLPPRIATITKVTETGYLVSLRRSGGFTGVRWHPKPRPCPAANIVRLATPREVEVGQVIEESVNAA